jgi:6-phospho-beta-glucosidase
MIGEVEEAIMGLIRQVKSYERLTIEAAIGRDKKKALLALMANPLVGSAEQALKVLASIQSRGIL